jgi:DNA-binding response OmpR family regulator
MPKVMVIDDEPFILMMIEDVLKFEGFDVVTLRDGRDAVERVRSEKPDLIILDWMMPEVSGITVSNALKSDPELSEIPVLMLTAKAQEDDEKLGLQSGVDRYITKPFSPRSLMEVVRKYVERRG